MKSVDQLLSQHAQAAQKLTQKRDAMLCAALLHDTLEDTQTTYDTLAKDFGDDVARMVQDLTSSNEEIARIGAEQLHLYRTNKDACPTKIIGDRLQASQLGQTVKLSHDKLDALIAKRCGKALYLTQKINTLPLDSALIKLCDRLDNVRDMELNSRFGREYSIETQYIVDNVDRTRLLPPHIAVLEAIAQAIKPSDH
jgi:(p)ppGpp synthase/HD superfamily hydrolase